MGSFALELEAGQSPSMPDDTFFRVLDVFFAGFILIELGLHFALQPWHFFTGPNRGWHFFDVFVAATSITELLFATNSGQNLTYLRLLRIVRMTKIFRVVRMFKFFKGLRQMILSIAGSLSSL